MSAAINMPKILWKTTDTKDLIIQISQKQWSEIYKKFFWEQDPLLRAKKEANDSEEIFDSVDALFDDLQR